MKHCNCIFQLVYFVHLLNTPHTLFNKPNPVQLPSQLTVCFVITPDIFLPPCSVSGRMATDATVDNQGTWSNWNEQWIRAYEAREGADGSSFTYKWGVRTDPDTTLTHLYALPIRMKQKMTTGSTRSVRREAVIDYDNPDSFWRYGNYGG